MFRISESSCSMCANPFPYVCSGCRSTIDDALKESDEVYQQQNSHQEQRIFVGSGEDVMFFQKG